MFRLISPALLLLSVFNSAAIALTNVADASDIQIRLKYREIEELSLSHKEGLNSAEVQKLFDFVAFNPIAKISDENSAKYDPDGIMGYCFGRAMAAHLIARSQFSLQSPSIRKVFMVGDLQGESDPRKWRFHVTTVVKGLNDQGEKSGWFAIDPIQEGPLPLKTWIDQTQSIWDAEKKAKLYWVENSVILPDLITFIDLKDRDQETGKRVVELKFDPEKRAGFKKRKLGLSTLYEVSPLVAAKYFYTLESDDPRYPFDLTSIIVNGNVLSYHHYFSDLIDSIYETLL